MFAIHNYLVFCRHQLRRWFLLTLLFFVGFTVMNGWCGESDPNSGTTARWVARAQEIFSAAQKRSTSEPTNNVAAWEFARAGFDRAELATNNAERAAIAVQGIDACRQALARDPKLAPAHYYLGMNLGQLARTKLLGALKLVGEMERAFKAAAALDEQFDHAGADRCLGLLYYEAPVIGSVGSRTKARKYLERAAELAPDFPENRLNLAEAYLKWREKTLLKRELDALAKLWPVAKTNLAGADWEAAWLDWSRREKKLRENSEALLKR
jgi:tetratricopeptide (TPR) repeat protein